MTVNLIKKKAKSKAKKPRKWLKRLSLTFLYITGICFFIGMGFIEEKLSTLPNVDTQYLQTYETSQILDVNGNVIYKPTEKLVETLTYEEIPELYKQFLIATEDKEFWTSEGFSIKGIFNMVTSTMRSLVDSNYKARGGSTIDQQLIKNKFFNHGKDVDVVTRKIQELFLAKQLNENFSKEEILTFYVNDLDFAENATGLKAIMHTYFNKTPQDYSERNIANIAELAYLTGLSQAPSSYNLYDNAENAHERMKIVLQIALEDTLISQEEYEQAIAYDLTTNLQPRYHISNNQYEQNLKYKTYTDMVIQELNEMGYDMNEVSLTINTFLDPSIYDTITEMARDPKYYLDGNQQIALTVMDTNGIVVAMVGSRYEGDSFNRATQQNRSSGSHTKPFTAYAPLLQYFGNKYTSASSFDTSNYVYPGTNTIMYNDSRAVYGIQSLMTCLRYSYNTPVARIDDQILGAGRMKAFLHEVGLDNKDVYSSVDGIGLNVSTLQSASAYNSLNNLGMYTEPRFIRSIIFTNGKEKIVEPKQHRAMNESVAWVINHILKGVPYTEYVSEAKIPSFVGYAGKTGSVAFDESINPPAPYGRGASDVWYGSITNGGYAITTWAGYDTPNTSPQIPNSYKGHVTLNRDIQIYLNKHRSVEDWTKPNTVYHISGSGLNAHYGVSDSEDINHETISWTNPESYEKIDVNEVTTPEHDTAWDSKEESPWFKDYNEGISLPPNIVNKETYDKMKGSE